MANIEQLRGQLEGVGDNDLVRYAQNPPANMPQYLVLAELQKRKSLREEKQEPPPQSTVKQDLIQGGLGDLQQQMPMQQPMPAGEGAPPQEAPVQEAAPEETVTAADGGLMSLPIPEDMFEEQSMAAGGIIAFEDGGEVPRFSGAYDEFGSFVDGSGYAPTGPNKKGYGMPFSDADSFLDMITPNELEWKRAIRYKQAGIKYTPPPGYDSKGLPITPVAQATEAKKSETTPPPAAPPAGPPGATPPLAPRASQVPGMPSVGNLTNPYTKSVMDRLAELNKPVALPADFVPASMTPQQAARGVQDMQKLFGVSEAGYDKYGKVLEQRMADLQSQKDKSGWLALARAGFETAAGTSPYALSNIGRGAIKGLEEYSMAQDKLLAAQDRLDLAQFNLSDAQNRFRMEGSREAARTLEERRRDVESARREAIKYGVSAESESRKANKSDLTKQVDASLAVQKENIDIALRKAGLELQRFNADTQRIIATRPEAFSTVISNLESDPNWSRLSGEERVNRITDAVNRMRQGSGTTLEAKKIAARQAVGSDRLTDPEWLAAKKKNDAKAMKDREAAMEAEYISGRKPLIVSGTSGAINGMYNPETGKIE